ncbi:MAG: pentapeptide repeat-containing protein [Candidatus Aenigmarchaeota archaeon]|nr:pentapeptide repeat-containing protein [Candidatus Aenigmarchaeota archaeon]
MQAMTVNQIMEEYRNGRRNFTNIICKNGDFGELNLEGSDFSFSDLSFSGFRHAKLNGCKFVKANLSWSNFTDAQLREADLTKVDAKYCSFNDAKMDNATLTGADFQFSVLFNVIMNFKDMSGTNFQSAAFHESDLNKEGVDHVKTQLMAQNNIIPYDTYLRAKNAIENVVKIQHSVEGQGFAVGYGSAGGGTGGYGASVSSGGYGSINLGVSSYGTNNKNVGYGK